MVNVRKERQRKKRQQRESGKARGRKNTNKCAETWTCVRRVGGGVDGCVGEGGFVVSVAACYHLPQPGRQFD